MYLSTQLGEICSGSVAALARAPVINPSIVAALKALMQNRDAPESNMCSIFLVAISPRSRTFTGVSQCQHCLLPRLLGAVISVLR